MRQLKGKPKKETSKDKKERKQAMQEARQQIATVVLPTLAVVVLLIVVFVYVATRPGAIECMQRTEARFHMCLLSHRCVNLVYVAHTVLL
ncbi:hypothetical protein AAFF_G00188390 [Aldrovandia affinis]|uniref:Single-pass membrane and coiled-coil domain-containing protein 4 n=1 Tax=Aldrovandia affinis TaxID=143900 RepID=A0AAD7SY14_9TELE|nr:hypothetical protein AAFF_G00188390 [Aldrovandia affinis]